MTNPTVLFTISESLVLHRNTSIFLLKTLAVNQFYPKTPSIMDPETQMCYNEWIDKIYEKRSDGKKEPLTKAEKKLKQKRGSSGLANLQKARIRKVQRRERMQELLKKRAAQKSKKFPKEVDLSKDYFLSNRIPSSAEQIVVSLRLQNLVRRLYDGSKLCKDQPGDSSSFSIINQDGLGKNPLLWSIEETSTFVKFISTNKIIAKIFRAEEIDGESLLNLTQSDLVTHFNFDTEVSKSIIKVITKLRTEVIERFLNI